MNVSRAVLFVAGMDEHLFVPDYEEEEVPTGKRKVVEGESEDGEGGGDVGRGGRKRVVKKLKCPLCPVSLVRVVHHVTVAHLPWFLAASTACWTCQTQFGKASTLKLHLKKSLSCDESGLFALCYEQTWARHTLAFLEKLARVLGLVSTEVLLPLAVHQGLYTKNNVGNVDVGLMAMFCRLHDMNVPERFEVQPPGHTVALEGNGGAASRASGGSASGVDPFRMAVQSSRNPEG